MSRVTDDTIAHWFGRHPTKMSDSEVQDAIEKSGAAVALAAVQEDRARLCRHLVRLKQLVEEAGGKPFDDADFWVV